MITGNSLSFNHKYGLTPTQRASALLKTKNKCVYCGKDLSRCAIKLTSREHIVPLAVFKWTITVNEYEDSDVWQLFNSPANCIIVCRDCNVTKGSNLPTEDTIYAITRYYNCNKNVRDLWKLWTDLTPYMDTYRKLFDKVLKKQGSFCKCCGRKLSKNYSSLRRLHHDEVRSEENACIVCTSCSARRLWKGIDNKEV